MKSIIRRWKERAKQKREEEWEASKQRMDARPWKILRFPVTIDGEPYILEGQFMTENGNSVVRVTDRFDLLLGGGSAFKFIPQKQS